ncbi:MAG: hypothetical protein AAF542_20540 [Pseudomonadota bacterium]
MFEFQLTEEISFAVSVIMVLAVLFVGARMHQNTRAVRSGNRQACLAFASKVYSELAADKHLAKLFRRGLNDFAALSVEDKVRLHYFLQSIVTLFRDSMNAYNEEVISKEEYESNRASTMAVLCMPGGKVWWQDAQNAYPQEIREALNLQGDISYALGDIYPYFLLSEDEEAADEKIQDGEEPLIDEEVGFSAEGDDSDWEIINQPISAVSLSEEPHSSEPKTNTPNDDALLSEQVHAANEDIQESTSTPKPDWRKGLARRQSRQAIGR